MKTKDRRDALRQTLITLATATIEREGTKAVKARSLAQEAGCSVGAIYNVFGDLNALLLAANSETFKALGAHVISATPTDAEPVDRMVAMSEAYLDFAVQHPRRWRALFDVRMSRTDEIPQWYLQALDKLLSLIDAPLRELHPNLPEEEIRLRTHTLFSAVHGIVLLGIEKRISAVQEDRLADMINYLLRSAAP